MQNTATTAARHSPGHAHHKPLHNGAIGPALTDYEGVPAGVPLCKDTIALLNEGPRAGQA
jgi:hypothetical protein